METFILSLFFLFLPKHITLSNSAQRECLLFNGFKSIMMNINSWTSFQCNVPPSQTIEEEECSLMATAGFLIACVWLI